MALADYVAWEVEIAGQVKGIRLAKRDGTLGTHSGIFNRQHVEALGVPIVYNEVAVAPVQNDIPCSSVDLYKPGIVK